LFRHYKNPKYLTPDAPKPLQLHPFFLIFGAILFWELFLHGLLFAEFNWRILFVIGWSVFFAIAFTILCGFLPRKGNLIVLWIILSVLYLWYSCQLIYFKIFGGFISVYLIQMGGEMMLSCYHIGPHETIGETYEKMEVYAKEHNYNLGEYGWERYVTDCWTTKNKDMYVTEVRIGVTR
jgi:hypothetical protein